MERSIRIVPNMTTLPPLPLQSDCDLLARPTVSVADAARILGISRGSAYRAISAGDLPALRLGRRLVVPTLALRNLLEAPGMAISNADEVRS